MIHRRELCAPSTRSESQAAAGYDSLYQFESAFLLLKPGDTGTFSVFFANTGATVWAAGTATQVNLAVCAPDKVTCNVASPNEIRAIRNAMGRAWAVVTPGVRPAGDEHHDQSRVATPRAAVEAGADYLVVGRPITGAPDPAQAAAAVLAEMRA